jgi:hypothetical protein
MFGLRDTSGHFDRASALMSLHSKARNRMEWVELVWLGNVSAGRGAGEVSGERGAKRVVTGRGYLQAMSHDVVNRVVAASRASFGNRPWLGAKAAVPDLAIEVARSGAPPRTGRLDVRADRAAVRRASQHSSTGVTRQVGGRCLRSDATQEFPTPRDRADGSAQVGTAGKPKT